MHEDPQPDAVNDASLTERYDVPPTEPAAAADQPAAILPCFGRAGGA